MPGLKQPALGITATALVIVLSLVFISSFDWTTFSGWVSYSLICTIPISIVISVFWKLKYPTFAAKRSQPLRGFLFLMLALVVGLVVGALHFFTLGGSVSPPTIVLLHYIIVSVVVTFWICIMWGGWPFVLMSNSLVAGFTLLGSSYVVNYVLFQIFFSYEFMRSNSLYHENLDPHGMFNAWGATVFYLVGLSSMFLLIHFDLWPLNRVDALVKQPVLGLVWTVIALALGAVFFTVGTRALGMDVQMFMVKVPVPFIFGSIVVLNMLRGSLFSRFTQPLKGIYSTISAGIIGTLLALAYGTFTSTVTGPLSSGPPNYDSEIWLASALLAVTFPFLGFYGDLFQMWPLAGLGDAKAVRDAREQGGDEGRELQP